MDHFLVPRLENLEFLGRQQSFSILLRAVNPPALKLKALSLRFFVLFCFLNRKKNPFLVCPVFFQQNSKSAARFSLVSRMLASVGESWGLEEPLTRREVRCCQFSRSPKILGEFIFSTFLLIPLFCSPPPLEAS